MKKKIYLDYNASAPLRPEAREAMLDILSREDGALNASSIHSFGREGRKIVEQARSQVAKLIHASTNQIIFNSGATEGNNTVIDHFYKAYPAETILVSAIEHPAILDLQNIYPNIQIIPVDKNGLVLVGALEEMLRNTKTSLVSCMHANNETGVIQEIKTLSGIAHKHGALFHTDATQSAGRIPVDMQQMGIDFLTLSSHKIGGPQGVGALALGLCGQTPTLLHGGGQEKSARAGTENVAGIAGFGAAANAALTNLEAHAEIKKYRDHIETRLKSISKGIIIHGENATRLCNTSFVSLPNTNAQSILMALDLEGIAISNGSACSSGSVKPSNVLRAMGLDDDIASSALRISLGWATCESDIDAFLKAWEKILHRIQKQ